VSPVDFATQFVGFNFEESDEPVRGSPRIVRIERDDRQGESSSWVEIVTYYDETHRVKERRVYRHRDSLACRELFEYEGDSPQITIRTLDPDGNPVSTRHRVLGADGEEWLTTNDVGELREKVTVKRDPEGQVVDVTSYDLHANREIHMTVGRTGVGELQVTVTFKQNSGTSTNVYILVGSDGKARFSYGGATASNRESAEIERRSIIQAEDSFGNWTKMAVFERTTANKKENLIASLTREITYYQSH
jgi:hypothetical protein